MDYNFGLIVKKYRSLAENKLHAFNIVMDTNFIQLSAIFLTTPVNEESPESVEVMKLIIDIFFILSAKRSYTAELSRVYGITEAVQFVVNRKSLPDDVHLKAQHILRRLSKYFVTKKLVFYVCGLNKDVVPKIESALISTKGVVSVVMDLVHLKSVVRVLPGVQSSDVATSVFEHTGIEIKLVSKNSRGQEMLVSFLESKISGCESDEEWPSYSEESSPTKEYNAITSRFDQKNSSSWIDSAVTFFQKSFYW